MTNNESGQARISSGSFSIRTMNVLLFVAGFTAAAGSFLYKAAQGDTDQIRWFVPFVALMPMGLMIALYWVTWLTGKMARRKN